MKRIVAAAFVAALVMPSPALAWGYDGHKFIAERVIALLPPELRPLFESDRAVFVERSIDPDLWQVAGYDPQEDPHHFLDFDWEGYGKYPFKELPHDYYAAVAKFGKERIEDNGTLPWRTEEMYGNLRRAFENYARRGGFARNNVIYFASWLTHYISDAHQPFHAVMNYDGQLTGQNGLHVRFEATLFERYRSQWTIAPKPIPPIQDAREFVFARALEGTQLVPAILKADLEAIGTRDVYDDAYYAAMFKANRAVMEQRLSESIAACAAAITGAWEAAGKPAVARNIPEQPQRRRR